MAETKNDPKAPTSSLGFSFNSTGSDNTTTEAIQPRLDDAAKQRRAILIGVVVLAVLAVVAISFMRTGLNPFAPVDSHGLQAPEHPTVQ